MELLILSILGIAISIYGLYVEHRKKKYNQYTPVCDINNKINCSKALTSKFGKHFGISNTVYGIIFYSILIILNTLNLKIIILILSTTSIIITLYLAHKLYYQIKNVCLVCTFTYLVNILIFIQSIINF